VLEIKLRRKVRVEYKGERQRALIQEAIQKVELVE
jgi:hypothetical protein